LTRSIPDPAEGALPSRGGTRLVAVLAWQPAGIAATLIVPLSFADFHRFIHWLIIGLAFTGAVGLLPPPALWPGPGSTREAVSGRWDCQLRVETQLRMLESTVNPHFLFNTLNTVLDLVREQPAKVESIILNL
jgi:hypothetical protein